MRKNLLNKFSESLFSILPISVLVIIFAFIQPDIDGGTIGLFAVCTVLLIVGMGLFTLGADMAMMPMGQSVGAHLSKSKKIWLTIIVCFVLGVLVTIAEPDLQVLAEQLSSGDGKNTVLLYAVALGVGLFLVIFLLKTYIKIKLSYILTFFYAIIFILAIFVPKDFLASAFDSGGVTTGPITVPFLMSLGIGLASVRGGKSNSEDSFGMIAFCSIGPIMAVMIIGLSGTASVGVSESVAPVLGGFADIMREVGSGFPIYLKEVGIALLPIVGIFVLFQIFALKLPKEQIIKLVIGILYTYIGLVIFLTGVNIGFMPMGKALGASIAASSYKWILVPLGVVIGCCIVLAEPAVHLLNKQVEEITGGAISRKTMMVALAAGISILVGLGMVRVLTGISIWYFLLPGYGIALLLSYFVPPVFTGIAFDSGGVSSGPMTATFLLPFAMGACSAVGGNILTDAFGMVAFVAMAPLITIQLLGLIFKVKSSVGERRLRLASTADAELALVADADSGTVDFDYAIEDTSDEDASTEENSIAFAADKSYTQDIDALPTPDAAEEKTNEKESNADE